MTLPDSPVRARYVHRVVAEGLRSRIRARVRRVEPEIPADLDAASIAIFERVRQFTMTGALRVDALVRATRHIAHTAVPGAFVECGVWRGGSMMAVADVLLDLGDMSRDLFLFDTFEGMVAPTAEDGERAATRWAESTHDQGRESDWCYASLDDVRANVLSTRYPADRIHFVRGRVEDTIPVEAPDQIALLRLDTDWYDSTRHELEHLYPRLQRGGVLIIDDYGRWQGARKAVDEFVKAGHSMLLNRIDGAGRLALKQ